MNGGGPSWTFLTNHAHVLLCLADDPSARLRDVASQVGITERAVQRIVSDLHEEGYISIRKEGRRNAYSINPRNMMHRSGENGVCIKDLLRLLFAFV